MNRTRPATILAVTALTTLAALAVAPVASARTCEVLVRLDDAVTLGALQFGIDYSSATGGFLANGDQVDCTTEIDQTLGTWFDQADQSSLNASFVSLSGFVGPQVLGTCRFDDTDGSVTVDDFVVTGVEAIEPEGDPVAPPAVSVRLPDCDPDTASTTTTSTSTSTTTTVPVESVCELTFRVTTAASIASLDWQVLYTNAFGEFTGEGGDVACTNLRPGSLTSFNDLDDERKVLGGLINLSGFTSPADIARCTFVPIPGEEPLASDFSVEVRAATDKDLEFLDPKPKMAISKLECEEPQVCGDGKVGSEEECDDGNLTSGDGCDASCIDEFCGDGIDNDGAAEECDDGNLANGDGCDAGCTEGGICGDANEDGAVQAGDALRILRFAVAQSPPCADYVCDTNDDGATQASDALRVLRRAVGQAVTLVCPTKAGN